jgi:poly(3-hydroxybutyrate) depolymerase
VTVLAAVAVMAEVQRPGAAAQHDADGRPRRHARKPDKRQRLARSKPIAWFERNLIARVPWRYRGAGRRVYPGSFSSPPS